jgi:hypothetical protein
MARTMLSESNSKKKIHINRAAICSLLFMMPRRDADHLRDVILVVVQVEVDVCAHTPELDGSLVVGSGKDHRTRGFQITLQFAFVNAEQACRVVPTLQQPAPCQTHLEKKRNNKKVHLLTKHGNRLNVKKEQQVSVFQVPIGQELTQVHLLPTVPANRSTGEREREMNTKWNRRSSDDNQQSLFFFKKNKKMAKLIASGSLF